MGCNVDERWRAQRDTATEPQAAAGGGLDDGRACQSCSAALQLRDGGREFCADCLAERPWR
jgi:hypothetical protein